MFNADLREVLKSQGYGVLHIREADRDGVFDLLITNSRHQHLWMELKIGSEELRASQRDFAKERRTNMELLLIGRLREGSSVEIRNYDDTEELEVIPDFRNQRWILPIERWWHYQP